MKAISFEKMSIESSDILSRLQMKKVKGGHSSGTCQYEAPTEFGTVPITGMSMADAKENARINGTHWCCDSCCTATWADHSGC